MTSPNGQFGRNISAGALLGVARGRRVALIACKRPTWADDRTSQPLILVVEDEGLIRKFVVEALRETGRCVLEASSGAEAIEIISAGSPVDLIFTDVRMPGSVDGFALLAFATGATPWVPVILTSGHFDPARALDAGAAAFLQKPYRFEEVERLIDASLCAQ